MPLQVYTNLYVCIIVITIRVIMTIITVTIAIITISRLVLIVSIVVQQSGHNVNTNIDV